VRLAWSLTDGIGELDPELPRMPPPVDNADSHPPDQVLAMLAETGFAVVIAEYLNEPTAGRDKGRYAIVAERR